MMVWSFFLAATREMLKKSLYCRKIKLSDGKLRETQTANYFSNFYLIDCAVPSANAHSCQKHGTLLPTGSLS